MNNAVVYVLRIKMQQLRDELEQVKDDLERARKDLEKERHGREIVCFKRGKIIIIYRSYLGGI